MITKLVKIVCWFIPSKKLRRKIRKNGSLFFANITKRWLLKSKKFKPADFKQIPIYIVSYNRLECLQKMINFLESKGYYNINIVDNASSYPPLLEYLKSLNYSIFYMEKNYGHMVFWNSDKFSDVIQNSYYVVTDPDVLPIEECPEDFLEIFYDLLQKYTHVTKVGFSLKIDDIPDCYEFKGNVIEWESQFYHDRIKYKNIEVYNADIDTTFALYRPEKIQMSESFGSAIRVGFPYQARHLPWYKDSNKQTEEDKFYISTLKKSSSTWSGDKTKIELQSYLDKIKKGNDNKEIKLDMKKIIKNNFEINVATNNKKLEFWNLYEKSAWEAETLNIFDYFIDPEHSYIDIGAWIGPTVLYGANKAKAVYAFEPDKAAFEELKAHLKLNENLTSKTKIFNFGISNGNKFETFYVGEGATSASSTIKNNLNKDNCYQAEFHDFPTTIKKACIDFKNVNFIKIDIEGGEYELIPHLMSILKEVNHFPALCISLHLPFVVKKGTTNEKEISFNKNKELIDNLHSCYTYIYLKDFSLLNNIEQLGGNENFTKIIATNTKYSNRSYIYKSGVDTKNENDSKAIVYNCICDNSAVLDVGCACGDLGIVLHKNKNCKIVGMEYDKDSIAVALKTGAYENIHQINLNNFNPDDFKNYYEKFDFIVFGDVLEHINAPQGVLDTFKKFLKKDGSFLISLPNIAHASIKMNLLLDDWTYTDVGILDKTHIKFFTRTSIPPFLAEIGLIIKSMKYTVMNKAGTQPNRPWKKLPLAVQYFVYKNPHSFVCQYVVEVTPAPEELCYDQIAEMNQQMLVINKANMNKNLKQLCLYRYALLKAIKNFVFKQKITKENRLKIKLFGIQIVNKSLGDRAV